MKRLLAPQHGRAEHKQGHVVRFGRRLEVDVVARAADDAGREGREARGHVHHGTAGKVERTKVAQEAQLVARRRGLGRPHPVRCRDTLRVGFYNDLRDGPGALPMGS